MAACGVLRECDCRIALKGRFKRSTGRCGILNIRCDIIAEIDAGKYDVRAVRHHIQAADAYAVSGRSGARKRMNPVYRKIMRENVEWGG